MNVPLDMLAMKTTMNQRKKEISSLKMRERKNQGSTLLSISIQNKQMIELKVEKVPAHHRKYILTMKKKGIKIFYAKIREIIVGFISATAAFC